MGRTKKEKEIIEQITNYCKNDCDIQDNCAKDECILWRIAKIIRER